MSTHVPPPSESAGAWLTRQMERRATTVRQLAADLGVTTQTIYDWRGDRATISEDRIPRIAEVLLVSEIEARRGLGYWVPADQEQPTGLDKADLVKLRQDLADVLERIDKLMG